MRPHPRFPDHIAVNHQTLPNAERRVAITQVPSWGHGVCVECPERLCSYSEDDVAYRRCLLSTPDDGKSIGVWMTKTTYAVFKLHHGETRALE